jgi:hypothetical protein
LPIRLRELRGRFSALARIARFFFRVIRVLAADGVGIELPAARPGGKKGIYCRNVPVTGIFACASAQNLSVY